MEIFIYSLLFLSVALNILLGIYFYNTFFTLIPKLENKLGYLYGAFTDALNRMRELDIKGRYNSAFEDDDEVGFIFESYKKIANELSELVENDDFDDMQNDSSEIINNKTNVRKTSSRKNK